jgi:hypothetical protein
LKPIILIDAPLMMAANNLGNVQIAARFTALNRIVTIFSNAPIAAGDRALEWI